MLDFTWHASQLHMSHSFCLSLHLRSVDLYLFLFKSRPCGHLVGLCPTCLFYSLRHGRLGLIEVFPFILLFTKVFPLVTIVLPFGQQCLFLWSLWVFPLSMYSFTFVENRPMLSQSVPRSEITVFMNLRNVDLDCS